MRTEAARPTERGAGPRTWRVLVGGGALLVIAFIVFTLVHDPRADAERPGPYALDCTSPKGAVARYGEFRARGAKPAGGWFRFEVFDAAKPEDAPAVLTGDRKAEPVWTPTQPELLALPERIRWRVSAVSADALVLDSKECAAERVQ
ncbi:MAG: hypothetical protein HZA53_18015 [Planctomycetes bacterium]|nr:hypothetical protein [Planctomycetota bacterium]